MMQSGFEVVYAITDYADGILAGVADFEGKPHIFIINDFRENDFRESEEARLYQLLPFFETALLPAVGSSSHDIWNPDPKIVTRVQVLATVNRPNECNDHSVRALGTFLPIDSSSENDLCVQWVRSVGSIR